MYDGRLDVLANFLVGYRILIPRSSPHFFAEILPTPSVGGIRPMEAPAHVNQLASFLANGPGRRGSKMRSGLHGLGRMDEPV
jgi:hypothetical protein